MTVKKFK